MANGTTLAQALILLKSKVGASISVGVANDSLYYQLIETKQEDFSTLFDWEILADRWEASVTGQFALFPTTDVNGFSNTINHDRPLQAFVNYSSKWRELLFGIDEDDYNIFDPDLNQLQEPIMRWAYKEGDRTRFEVWPVGTATQTVRFVGQRKVASLRTTGSLDPTKTLELDDRLVTFAVAVDILTGKDDASAKSIGEMLSALWKTLRSSDGSRRSDFGLAQELNKEPRRVVPITVG